MTKSLEQARAGAALESRAILRKIRNGASDSFRNATANLLPTGERLIGGIAKFGQAIEGNAAYYNEFISGFNAVAREYVDAMVYKDPYKDFYGEDLTLGALAVSRFFDIPKPYAHDKERGDETIFKRVQPESYATTYSPNTFIQFKGTEDERDIQRAFSTAEGVAEVMATITSRMYTGMEYARALMFQSLLIKAGRSGEVQLIGVDASNPKDIVKELRAITGEWEFPDTQWNRSQVKNVASLQDTVVLMTPRRRADLDEVLAYAFNSDKVDFMGRVYPIKEIRDFDNDYFSAVYNGDENFEPVDADDVARMDGFLAMVTTRKFFVIHRNHEKFGQIQNPRTGAVNNFLTFEGTYATSRFENCAMLFDKTKLGTITGTPAFKINAKAVEANGIVGISFEPNFAFTKIANLGERWEQTDAASEDFVAVEKRLVSFGETSGETVELRVWLVGVEYKATLDKTISAVGESITFEAVV